jgi:peptidylprolyl isomerase
MSENKHSAKSRRKVIENKTKSNYRLIALAIFIVVIAVLVFLLAFNNKQTAPATSATPGAQTSSATKPNSKQYSAAPPMTIDKSKKYTATVKMAKGGEFVIQLYPDKAPITVNSFVFLAREGFFNGVTFHRVINDFMAQGGDPTGKGSGGPGYEFVNEDSDLTFDKPGVVAMANAGRDTNGSQFFITFVPNSMLNGGYTIFGQVISGMDVVNGITRRDPNQNPAFPGDAIETITIKEE